MKLTGNKLLLEWTPTTKIGSIYTPSSELDYHNTDSVKMFKVLDAGPGEFNRKGVFVPNEVKPGDKVILDCRTGGRPEEIARNQFVLKDASRAIAVCPIELCES